MLLAVEANKSLRKHEENTSFGLQRESGSWFFESNLLAMNVTSLGNLQKHCRSQQLCSNRGALPQLDCRQCRRPRVPRPGFKSRSCSIASRLAMAFLNVCNFFFAGYRGHVVVPPAYQILVQLPVYQFLVASTSYLYCAKMAYPPHLQEFWELPLLHSYRSWAYRCLKCELRPSSFLEACLVDRPESSFPFGPS